MTKDPSSFRLFPVRWIVFFVIVSLLFGFQQRPFTEIFGNSHSEETHNHHEDMQTSLFETFEILLTGNLTHTHEHDDSDGESHEHSHEHHFNGTISSAVLILVQVHFSFPMLDLVWNSAEISPDLNPYYSEILKPPIFA